MRARLKAWAQEVVAVVNRATGGAVRIVPRPLLHTIPEQEHLRRFFAHHAVDCVFDVGANDGQYARTLRRDVGYRGPIVSFEPLPDCAARLRRRAARDGRWEVEEVALTEAAGSLDFHVTADTQFASAAAPNESGTELFPTMSRVERRIAVRADTVAAALDRHRRRLGFRHPFLKMDTQGHDLAVARGAGEALDAFVGLQSELAIVPLYEGAPDWREAIAFYEGRGFRLSALVPNTSGHFPRLLEIDCIMENERFAAPGRR